MATPPELPVPQMGAMENRIAKPYDFSLDQLVTESWHRVHGAKATLWGAFAYVILFSVAFMILNVLASTFLPETIGKVANIILQVISTVIIMPLMLGLSYLGMRRSVNLPIRANQIFSMFHYFWRLVGMLILQYVIIYALIFFLILSIVFSPTHEAGPTWLYWLAKVIQVGLVFAIIYVGLSFIFSFLLIVEKNLKVFAAYKASFLAFTQHWVKITLGLIFMFTLYIIGFALLFIPAIWIAPMFFIFTGTLYRNAFGVEEARVGR